MSTNPSSYDIAKLLTNGVQPFAAIDDTIIDAMADEIRRMGRDDRLPVAVVLTHDGVLIDGFQRLTAMLRAGKKRISSLDVKRLSARQCKGHDAAELAIELNMRRRHLTADEKARLAASWIKKYGWTQTKVADLLGVTQGRISQLMKLLPEEERPDTNGLGRPPKPTPEAEAEDDTPTPKPKPKDAGPVTDLLNLSRQFTDPAWSGWVLDTIAKSTPETADIAHKALETITERAEALRAHVADLIAVDRGVSDKGEPF